MIKSIVASIVIVFFWFSSKRLEEFEVFLAQNYFHSKGNFPLQFQLITINRFGGVREQTNKTS